MNWKRTLPVVSILLLSLVGVLSGTSAGLTGDCKVVDQARPQIAAHLFWEEELLVIRAYGEGGAPGVLRGVFRPTDPNAVAIPFERTFQFDGNGEWTLTMELRAFASASTPAFDAAFDVLAIGPGGEPMDSEDWGLRMVRLDPTSPQFSPVPAGGVTFVPIPGTTTPLFPLSHAIVPIAAPSTEIVENLMFLCAVTGVEGVLPVH